MVGFEKALGAVKVIDQIQYRSQGLLNLARGYFNKHLIFGGFFSIILFAKDFNSCLAF